MSKKERTKRQEARERGELKKRLLTYSVAAGAALIGAQAANAGIVYSGPLSVDFGYQQVTMEGTHPDVVVNGFTWNSTYAGIHYMERGLQVSAGYWSNGSTSFDANVRFHATMKTVTFTYYSSSDVAQRPFAVALSQSATMGPSQTLGAYEWAVPLYMENKYGQWGDWAVDGQKSHLGIKLEAEGGGDLYGWMEIERVDKLNGRVLGWAYDDSGAAIHIGDTGEGGAPVPEPSGLALLAAGAAGVTAFRRKRTE